MPSYRMAQTNEYTDTLLFLGPSSKVRFQHGNGNAPSCLANIALRGDCSSGFPLLTKMKRLPRGRGLRRPPRSLDADVNGRSMIVQELDGESGMSDGIAGPSTSTTPTMPGSEQCYFSPLSQLQDPQTQAGASCHDQQQERLFASDHAYNDDHFLRALEYDQALSMGMAGLQHHRHFHEPHEVGFAEGGMPTPSRHPRSWELGQRQMQPDDFSFEPQQQPLIPTQVQTPSPFSHDQAMSMNPDMQAHPQAQMGLAVAQGKGCHLHSVGDHTTYFECECGSLPAHQPLSGAYALECSPQHAPHHQFSHHDNLHAASQRPSKFRVSPQSPSPTPPAKRQRTSASKPSTQPPFQPQPQPQPTFTRSGRTIGRPLMLGNAKEMASRSSPSTPRRPATLIRKDNNARAMLPDFATAYASQKDEEPPSSVKAESGYQSEMDVDHISPRTVIRPAGQNNVAGSAKDAEQRLPMALGMSANNDEQAASAMPPPAPPDAGQTQTLTQQAAPLSLLYTLWRLEQRVKALAFAVGEAHLAKEFGRDHGEWLRDAFEEHLHVHAHIEHLRFSAALEAESKGTAAVVA